MKPSILVVDDDHNIREAFHVMLEEKYNPILTSSGEEALQKIKKNSAINLVLLDLNLPNLDGIETLAQIKEMDPTLDVIMVTANTTTESAIKSMKYGAYDYIVKPFDVDALTAVIQRAMEKRELTKLNQALSTEIERLVDNSLIGESQGMRQIHELIDKVSRAESTVLIQGDSGTGKELVARALHKRGNRSSKPFVAVSCAAIPSELVESEFFGHERGAFTSAVSRKLGKFEFADGGIIFLDDVGELPLPIQAKLLRVLQEKEIVRVGSNEVIPVDVRVFAATNVDLRGLVQQGKFREDLYYRLKVVPIEIPPLRDRRDDIPLLINHFLKKSCEQHRKPQKRMDPEALNLMIHYNWPGNVRELENLIEMMVLLAGEVIHTQDLPANVFANQALHELLSQDLENMDLKTARQKFERQFITHILEKNRWNQTRAAEVMGIHRNTLIIKMGELGIKKELNV